MLSKKTRKNSKRTRKFTCMLILNVSMVLNINNAVKIPQQHDTTKNFIVASEKINTTQSTTTTKTVNATTQPETKTVSKPQNTVKKVNPVISDEAVSLFDEYADKNQSDNVVFNKENYSVDIKRGNKSLHISQEQLKDMFKITYYEANVEPYKGKVAVVNVILNRAFAQNKNVHEIIYQKNQFSPVGEGKMKKDTYNASCIKAVFEGLSNRVVAQNVLYFCEPDISQSKWMLKERTYVTTIGKHVFYK